MDALLLALIFLLPVVILIWPRWPKWPRRDDARCALAILIVWILLVVRGDPDLPRRMEAAHLRGNDSYDGTGASTGLLVFGWAPAVVFCLPALGLRKLIDLRLRRQAPKEPAVRSDENL